MNVRFQGRFAHFRTVTFDGARNAVELIDQRSLPHQFRIVSTPDYRATAQAIRNMLVRGAGAIGATAAYGLAQGARSFRGQDLRRFNRHLHRVFATLHAARPTAVDPLNAMRELLDAMRPGQTVLERQALALAAAEQFAQRSVEECQAIGRHGAPLIRPGMRILTHCNAGWLAFVDYGSATAPLYAAHARRRRFHVYCDETRPRSQGATLTAWELAQQGISHEIIADNAAGHLLRTGQAQKCFVGSDRTAANGDVANKIGTYMLALAAHDNGVPFHPVVPTSTIDLSLPRGDLIPIEERAPDEVLDLIKGDAYTAPEGARTQGKARNPAFDVTPARLVTGIVTENGVAYPPFEESLKRMVHG
jgi:methylthioribose-1-phosphate isomerase